MRKTVKNSLITLLFICILAALIVAYSGFENSGVNASEEIVNPSLNTINAPEQHSRILVVAPHNDDEAIGASEFISRSIKNGCDVKIAMVTNNEDFKRAFNRVEKLLTRPKPLDYVKYGYRRQNETIDAMELIGVKKSCNGFGKHNYRF